MHLGRIRNAEFFAQATVVKPGRKFYPKMKTQAASTLFSIRIIRILCLRPFGRRGDSRGFFRVVGRAADYIDLKTTASHGNALREMVFLTEFSAGSASLFPELIPIVSMRLLKRRTAASSAPMTP